VDWRDAVQPTEAGFRLLLEAHPGARRAAFPDGFNAWRGRIGVAVRAPPQEGKANREVVALVADFFGVPRAGVAVELGVSDSRKVVAVTGLDAAAGRRLLEAAL